MLAISNNVWGSTEQNFIFFWSKCWITGNWSYTAFSTQSLIQSINIVQAWFYSSPLIMLIANYTKWLKWFNSGVFGHEPEQQTQQWYYRVDHERVRKQLLIYTSTYFCKSSIQLQHHRGKHWVHLLLKAPLWSLLLVTSCLPAVWC